MKNNKTGFAVVSIIMPILIPIIIIVLLASAVIAIFNGVIDIITEVCGNLVDFLKDPLGWLDSVAQDAWNFLVTINPTDIGPNEYSFDPGSECKFFLDSSLVDELANALSSGGMIGNSEVSKGTLDLEKTGLTKDALRELIVASYVTQATTDTIIGIEIPEKEMNVILKGALDVYLTTDDAGLFQDALNVVINTFSDIRGAEQAILSKIVEEIMGINGRILNLEDIIIM